jgi:hypothetical protein
MITEKQRDLMRQVVAQIDRTVIARGGRELPEAALHSWHDRLLELCQDFARAGHLADRAVARHA